MHINRQGCQRWSGKRIDVQTSCMYKEKHCRFHHCPFSLSASVLSHAPLVTVLICQATEVEYKFHLIHEFELKKIFEAKT